MKQICFLALSFSVNRLLLFVILYLPFHELHSEQLCQLETIQSTTPVERFTLINGVATDSLTGLMWQRCFVGASGDGCSEGTPTSMSWAMAMQYSENLNKSGGFAGYADWRLPNIRELQSIAELQCVEPTLNSTIFPLAPVGRTWSSSPYQFYPHYSWFVDFKFFEVTYQERYNPYYVVLVRVPNS